MYSTPAPSAAQRADLHTRARRQAQLLRRQASVAFWHGVRRTGVAALQATRHGLQRLAQLAHLSRHPSGV